MPRATVQPVESTTPSPIDARRFSLDLVPAGAYWRKLTQTENKIDFAAVEAEEGASIERMRLRLGLLLVAQANAVVAWTKTTRFTPAAIPDYELPLLREFRSAFTAFCGEAYWDGARTLARSL